MPSSVAIIGASADRAKFGNKSVRAHAKAGYRVFPINPSAAEVEGLRAYRSISDVPVEKLDRISIYLPPAVALTVLDDITSKSVDEVWLNPGADAPEVVAKAKELGLPVVVGCSIVDLGMSPSEFG